MSSAREEATARCVYLDVSTYVFFPPQEQTSRSTQRAVVAFSWRTRSPCSAMTTSKSRRGWSYRVPSPMVHARLFSVRYLPQENVP